VCPVNCFYDLLVEDAKYRNQLWINPDECINCAACEPECPWQAIFEDAATPDIFKEDTELNKTVFTDHTTDQFTTEPEPIRHAPTPEEIQANFVKWGYKK
jgi:ferredoxin